MLKLRLWNTGLLLLVFFLLLEPHPLEAHSTGSFHWDAFNVDITVLPDGKLHIVETQTASLLPDMRHGYRSIPRGPGALLDSINNGKVVEIVDGERSEYRGSNRVTPGTYLARIQEGDYQIHWYFTPGEESRTFEVSYDVEGAVRHAGTEDQVIWIALPADLGAEVFTSRISITVPEGGAIQQTLARVNDRSDNIRTILSEDSQIVFFILEQPRRNGSTVEVGASFPTGLVPGERNAWEQILFDNLVTLVIGGIIVTVGAVGLLLLWYVRGRDPKSVGGVPSYLTEPPDDLPPAVVGSLIDEHVNECDIMATVLDLAQRGYISIRDLKGDYEVSPNPAAPAAEQLRPFEVRLLSSIVRSDGRTGTLKKSQNKLARSVPAIQQDLYAELVSRGLFARSPQETRQRYRKLAKRLLFPGTLIVFLAAMLLSSATFFYNLLLVGAVASVAGIVYWSSTHLPAKTPAGAESAARWLAFKRFLETRASEGRTADPEGQSERYLAYAVAFGLRKQWLSLYTRHNPTSPPWFSPLDYPRQPVGVPGGTPGGTGLPDYVPSTDHAPAAPTGLANSTTLEGASNAATTALEGSSDALGDMLEVGFRVAAVALQIGIGLAGGGSGGGSGGFD